MSETAPALRLDRYAPLGGLLGVLGVAMAFVLGGADAWKSYAYGWIFAAGLVLGSLALVILHNTIRATWTLSILRIAEAISSPTSIFVLFLGWLPIALNLRQVYLWADPEHVKGDHILEAKAFFLNPTMFIGCSIAYFFFFFVISGYLRRSSLRQDENQNVNEAQARANVASPSLLFFVIVCTFALTHWVMSLEPHWFSTVYGLLSLVGQTNAVVAIGTIILCANANREPYKGIVNSKLTKDLGNILFCTTMVWAYLTLSQFLITWSGNLPEEIPYYKVRAELGWNILGTILIIGRFFIPFFALLASRTKRSVRGVMIVACWILGMHLFDVFWLVVPSFERGGLFASMRFSDLFALVGMCGFLLAAFAYETKKGALVPTHDNRLREQHGHA